MIFAAGVRPRDELARDAGLALAERGGILTDTACVTADPDIYAIGEVAAIEGRCYGLVGPGYTSAEVVADRLLGGGAEFREADMSTKLKLLGVDVASFGDAMGRTPECLEVAVNDAVNETYAKLVLSDDAKTLLGGILVGDASAYGVLRPMVGEQLPGDPLALIAPAGSAGDAAQLGVGALPAGPDLFVQQRHQGRSHRCDRRRLRDVPALKRCTQAGTSCGSCVPLLRQLLEAEGVEQSKAVCEHFSQSRAELFEIIGATEIRTFSGLIDRFGTGKGCDLCKPVVASILASTGSDHILDGEQASLQDSNDHFLANIQRNGSYSVVPRVPGGDITPEHLILIGEIARDFSLYTKITGGQRIDMFGATVDQLPEIWRRLVDGGMESGHAYGKALRTVKSCVGSDWCRYGQQDSVQMAINLELRYRGLRAPHKIKMGVSGCARECAEARAQGRRRHRHRKRLEPLCRRQRRHDTEHAQLLAGDLDDDTLVRYIDRFLMFYIRTADRLQRTAPWVERGRPGAPARGGLRRFAGAGRRVRDGDRAPRGGLRVRVEGRAGGSRQAVAVRLVRQRARGRRSDGHVHRRVRGAGCRRRSVCRRCGVWRDDDSAQRHPGLDRRVRLRLSAAVPGCRRAAAGRCPGRAVPARRRHAARGRQHRSVLGRRGDVARHRR